MARLTESQIDMLDSQNMRDLLVGFPDQWRKAMKMTETVSLSVDAGSVRNICFAGMGGSAIGADLIRSYSYNSCPHPVQVVRHYETPSWVNKHTLFIVCSFSGKTEETLTAANSALDAGAQIIAVTSGGDLMVRATQDDLDYIKIPGGIPPRAALGYSFVPLFRIFQHLGYLDEPNEALEETAEYLERQGRLFTNTDDNEALGLAEDLADTLPVIYSDSTTMEPINLRWRSQFAENAKTLAYGNTLPEMSHNEIVGWDQIVHLTGRLSVIMLKDQNDHPKVQQRMQIVQELIEGQVSSLSVLKTRGESRLTRMFSLVQLADWTSFYLAMLNQVDPTPVAKIDLLKRKLSEL